ncbi:MAG: hypothetical protein U0793_15550 [Gemmataceae bacterium]
MDLREALAQISEIRQQVARGETFRGFKALPVAFSGLLAGAAALYQALALPEPQLDLAAYFRIWLGAALIALVVTGLAVYLHCRQPAAALRRQLAMLVLGQFLPCLIVGGLVLFVLWHQAPQCLWILPGLWSILFGLGIFATWRLLPGAIFWVGVFYVTAGCFTLAWAQGEHALSPWAMGLPFGVGQLLTAAILYWTLERSDVEETR